MTLGQDIEHDINDAIAKVIAQHEGGYVTKWLALVETVGPDGDRGLWTCTSDDIKAWDTCGLLQHALHLQAAQTLRRDEE